MQKSCAMKQLATALFLLVCVAFTSAQTCRPATAIQLSFGICLNLDEIRERIHELTIGPFSESRVTVDNIVVQEFEPAPTGCGVRGNLNRDLVLTLQVNSFEITGNIRRRRAFRVRRGTFRARGSDTDVTCTIPTDGTGRCVFPDRITCTAEYSGGFNVDFTGRLLGIIAKRRIQSRIRTEIPNALAKGMTRVVNAVIDRFEEGSE